ncbi:MAG: microcin C ABC transporter ATP-binding protein YejF [Candidatus Syntrophoarchaeum caldarius]|uniref:Microcin C ABC transporter ATP-binding protein YejF n=1 Tax=Candidatus Syntropharchaeum caldarium TaxID=1838285 RepID=A0A1F2PB96_9EURY|nr:MAG: microcin C ABC transporter ATP-binding protein YejF [Candidatus Syntrophoarchaeum caldarius]
MQLLKLKNVSLVLNETELLSCLNFEINEQDIIGITGRRGAGKSLLLHLIKGVEGYEPVAGEIRYHIRFCERCKRVELPSKPTCPICHSQMELLDIDLHADKQIHDAIKRRVGLMFQKTQALFSFRTVEENILEALRTAKFPYEMRDERTREIIEMMNITHRREFACMDLSCGEKQRVIVGRLIALDPLLMLLDSPESFLDPLTTSMICSAIRAAGLTVMMSSSRPQIFEGIADRILFLDKGKIEQFDRVDPEMFVQSTQLTPTQRSEGAPLIRLKGVCKYYAMPVNLYSKEATHVRAVDDLDITIQRGEIHGLVGVSGSGKSTILKIIWGDEKTKDFRGNCEFTFTDGRYRLDSLEAIARARTHISYLGQDSCLIPSRTIFDNLKSFIAEDKLREAAIDNAMEVLLRFGFSEEEVLSLYDRLPSEISAGEAQLILISMAILRDPEVILLDDPTSALDAQSAAKLADVILQIRATCGTSFLIASNDTDLLTICDHIDLIQEGRMAYCGTSLNECLKIMDINNSQSL